MNQPTLRPNYKKVTSPNDFPDGEHFAVFLFKQRSIYHEGDQRSRDNPGHGYGAYTEEIRETEYLLFASEADLRQWLLLQESSSDKVYVVIRGTRVKVEKKSLLNSESNSTLNPLQFPTCVLPSCWLC